MSDTREYFVYEQQEGGDLRLIDSAEARTPKQAVDKVAETNDRIATGSLQYAELVVHPASSATVFEYHGNDGDYDLTKF